MARSNRVKSLTSLAFVLSFLYVYFNLIACSVSGSVLGRFQVSSSDKMGLLRDGQQVRICNLHPPS